MSKFYNSNTKNKTFSCIFQALPKNCFTQPTEMLLSLSEISFPDLSLVSKNRFSLATLESQGAQELSGKHFTLLTHDEF